MRMRTWLLAGALALMPALASAQMHMEGHGGGGHMPGGYGHMGGYAGHGEGWHGGHMGDHPGWHQGGWGGHVYGHGYWWGGRYFAPGIGGPCWRFDGAWFWVCG